MTGRANDANEWVFPTSFNSFGSAMMSTYDFFSTDMCYGCYVRDVSTAIFTIARPNISGWEFTASIITIGY